MDKIDEAIIDSLPSRRFDADDTGAIRTSLRENGFVIVPVEATEKMLHAAKEAWTLKWLSSADLADESVIKAIWSEMLATAQER